MYFFNLLTEYGVKKIPMESGVGDFFTAWAVVFVAAGGAVRMTVTRPGSRDTAPVTGELIGTTY